jgi:hypothetical protein
VKNPFQAADKRRWTPINTVFSTGVHRRPDHLSKTCQTLRLALNEAVNKCVPVNWILIL